MLKPESRAYELAASNMGFSPKECFFTDDLEKNIIGATKVGMDAVLFKDAIQLRRDLIERKLIKVGF